MDVLKYLVNICGGQILKFPTYHLTIDQEGVMAFRLLLFVIFFITTICVNAQGNLPKHFESLPVFSDSQMVQDNYIDNLDHSDIQTSIQYGTITGETEYFNGINWEPYGLSFETIEEGLTRKYYYNEWLPMSFYYNSEGKISEIWTHQRERDFYTYDGNNNLIEILKKWITGENQRLYLYTYDANNFLIERIIKSWNTNDWMNSIRYIYTNNLIGLPIEILTQYWTWNGTNWTDNTKYFYFYDANNNLIETIILRWDNLSSTWVNNQHYSYTYNGNNLRTEYILQYWQNEQWVDYSKTEYFYDTNLNLTETKEYYWENTDWTYRYHTTYSINENNSLAVVFPTPGRVYDPNSIIQICWVTLNIPYVEISFSSDGGQNWEVIATNVPDTGDFVFDWIGYPLGIEYGKIKVADSQNPNIYAISYGYFRTKVFREYDFLTHNTNSVQFSIFNNGYLGPDNNYQAAGFQFNGLANTLFAGGIIVSTPSVIANGMIFGIRDFTNYSPMLDFTSNNVFNQMSYTNIIDSYAPIPSGLIVGQQTCSRENDDYVFVTYNVHNPTGETIDDVFVGIFADWDIENAQTNLGGIDPTNKIIYQYQPNASTDNNYYGIGCLSEFSGASVNSSNLINNRQVIYNFITNNIFGDITQPDDYRSFIGSGPFTLNPGESVITGFVFLAASDMTSLVNKAIEAQQLWDNGFTFTEITGLTADTPAGSQSLEVLNTEGFSIGDLIIINPGGQNEETNTITGFGSLLLQSPLQFDHSAGELIVHLVPVGVEDNPEGIPTEYSLSQNYPNPFNPTTSIRYSIPELSFVNIKIFDVLGSEIETLVNEEKSIGNYEVNFDASKLATGIYFYRIKAGQFVETKKMVLIK